MVPTVEGLPDFPALEAKSPSWEDEHLTVSFRDLATIKLNLGRASESFSTLQIKSVRVGL